MGMIKNVSQVTTEALRHIIIITLLIVLVGCSNNVRVELPITQQSLLTECPVTLPSDYPMDGSGYIMLAKEWSSIYHQCATRHNALVQYIQELNNDR